MPSPTEVVFLAFRDVDGNIQEVSEDNPLPMSGGGGGGGVTSLTNTDGSLDITGSGALLIATDVAGMLTALSINSAAIDPSFTSDGSDLFYNSIKFNNSGHLCYEDGVTNLVFANTLYYGNAESVLADNFGQLWIADGTNLGATLTAWQTALGINGVTETTTPVTSITTVNGIITAMS